MIFATMHNNLEALQYHPDDGAAVLLNGVNLARQAIDLMSSHRSYRSFGVGAVSLFRETAGTLRLFTGANVKPHEVGPKICAERMLVNKLRQSECGSGSMLAMFVAGPPQPDNGSGIATPTLHPCNVCREMYFEEEWGGRWMTNNTLIVTVAPPIEPETGSVSARVFDPRSAVYEIYTRVELRSIHEEMYRGQSGNRPPMPLSAWPEIATRLPIDVSANTLSLYAARTALSGQLAVA